MADERVILFVDRSLDDVPVAIWSGAPPTQIDPVSLAVTRCEGSSREGSFILCWLSEHGEILALDQCNVLDDAFGKAWSLARIARERWHSCDLLLPDAWSQIPLEQVR